MVRAYCLVSWESGVVGMEEDRDFFFPCESRRIRRNAALLKIYKNVGPGYEQPDKRSGIDGFIYEDLCLYLTGCWSRLLYYCVVWDDTCCPQPSDIDEACHPQASICGRNLKPMGFQSRELLLQIRSVHSI